MIEVARYVSVQRNPFDNDIFDSMAGGVSFDNTFAGSGIYSPLIVPQANPASIGKSVSVSMTAQLMHLNEDFVELVLLGSKISNNLSDTEIRVAYLHLEKVLSYMVRAVGGNVGDGGNSGFDSSFGDEYGQSLASALGSTKSGFVKSGFQSYASFYAGAFGVAVAGSLYDAVFNGDANFSGNLATAVVGEFIGIASTTITQGIIGRLGVTSLSTAMATNFAIGMIIGELFEMAVGLDNHFGYGGELIGHSIGREFRTKEKDFATGLKDSATDLIGELGGFFSGNGYASTSEIEMSNILDTVRNDLIGTLTSDITLANMKTLEVLQAVQEMQSSNMSDRGNDGSLSGATETGRLDSYTTTEERQRNQTYGSGSDGSGGYGGTDNGGADGQGNGESNHSR